MNYPVNYGGGIKVQAISISNDGNTESWPVFKVTGDFFLGFSITDGGNNKITYNGIVTMTDPVTIDTGAGTATQGRTDKSVNLSSREWFSIPAGKSIQPIFLPKQDAAGWCDIMYRDTWI
jgi:phage-related protein